MILLLDFQQLIFAHIRVIVRNVDFPSNQVIWSMYIFFFLSANRCKIMLDCHVFRKISFFPIFVCLIISVHVFSELKHVSVCMYDLIG